MTSRTARNYLLYQLQSEIYSDLYVHGGEQLPYWRHDNTPIDDPQALVPQLSAANSGIGHWESGWQLLAVAPGELAVRKDGLTVWVQPTDCSGSGDRPGEIGSKVKVRLSKELLNFSPGYFMALSNEGDDSENHHAAPSLVRIYWNVNVEGARVLMLSFTTLLNEARLFFRMKALNETGAYARCDAVVVYVRKAAYPQVADLLRGVYPQVAGYLKAPTPLFTKRVAPGVGVAEDPGQGESFGQHRCRLLADGMILGYERGARSLDQRLGIVADRFRVEGIKLSQPYLNTASSDIYPLWSIG